jgi:hypothetical protein
MGSTESRIKMTNVMGAATLSDLRISTAASGYVITLRCAETEVNTTKITVIGLLFTYILANLVVFVHMRCTCLAASLHHLQFQQQPSTVKAGRLDVTASVLTRDEFDNFISHDNTTVLKLSVVHDLNPYATLVGPDTAIARDGVVSIAHVGVSRAGLGIRLLASAVGAQTSVLSEPFVVTGLQQYRFDSGLSDTVCVIFCLPCRCSLL